MEYTEEQLNKLPKWAQLEIKRLNRDNQWLNTKLMQINSALPTNTFIEEGLDERPIPNNSSIRFKVGEKLENAITVRIVDGEYIDINSNGRANKQMVILPRASNSVYIKFIDR